MIERIVKRDGRIVPFNREKITFAILQAAVAVGGRDRETAAGVTDEVIRMLEERKAGDSYPTVEEVQDLVEKALIERGHARTAKAYIVYRYEHALKRAGKKSLTYSPDNIPYSKLWEALSWAVDNGAVTLKQIGDTIRAGKIRDLVRDAEAFYHQELDKAAEKLLERLDEIKMIIIAGPSSSGKTTTTIKIGERLKLAGYSLVPINVDHYFLDLEQHPKDSGGDFDFETPQALDLSSINRDLVRLLQGEKIEIPYYNFKTGRKEGTSGKLQIGEREIILIDSLHGLYPEMTADIPADKKFRFYIETLSQVKDRNRHFIRWADIRLLRRMVRDMQFRNYSPKQTIRHWHYVRRSELRYIVPRLREADVIVNSFLTYELPVMKHRLGRFFPEFIAGFKHDPERADALERAVRVSEIFEEIPAWQDEEVVPEDSLLREFIGGSAYRY
ncbi:Uridine kinase [subsurface metagenome]